MRPPSSKTNNPNVIKSALTFLLSFLALASFGQTKKIVFIAGPPSHGPGEHEYRAGLLLFKSCLDELPNVSSVLYSNGWPQEANALDGAATIVVYCDGGPADPILQEDRLKTIGAQMD